MTAPVSPRSFPRPGERHHSSKLDRVIGRPRLRAVEISPPWGLLDSFPAAILHGRMADNDHSSHPAIIKRLNRATGHLRSIVAMIEEDRPCVDIAQQLQAVESAIASAKRALIHDHVDHCLGHANSDEGAKVAVEQFRAISKYW